MERQRVINCSKGISNWIRGTNMSANPKGASALEEALRQPGKSPSLKMLMYQVSEQSDTALRLSCSEQGFGLETLRVPFLLKSLCKSMIPHNTCSNGVEGASSSILELWGLLLRQNGPLTVGKVKLRQTAFNRSRTLHHFSTATC